MLNIFTKISRKAKAWLTYPYYQSLFLRHTLPSFTPKEGRYAIVHFDSKLQFDDYGRYFYTTCLYLQKAGYRVVVKASLHAFKAYRQQKPGFLKFLWREDFVFVRKCAPPLNTLVLVQPGTEDHLIRLLYGYNITRTGSFDCIAPYPMHPAQYRNHPHPSQLAKTRRTIRVLFSGKAKEDLYPNERVRAFFPVMSRREVIQTVLSRFENSRLLNKEADKEVLEGLLTSNTYANEIIISEVKTAEKDWLPVLSKADFFICPPGSRMPWCHNCVEAMAVGTIPILEYAALFSPPLQNGKNCLTYSGPEELGQAIAQALSMQEEEIAAMREQVVQYYQEHLSLESITGKLQAFAGSAERELTVAIPFVPTWEEMNAIPLLK